MKNNYLLHFSLFMAMLLLPLAAWGQTTQSLNIENGSITITSTGYTIGNGGEQAYSGAYTISGTTTSNTVTVSSGTHNITLDGASIDVSTTDNSCAFAIAADAQVNLTLTGENVLKSGLDKAALNVPAEATLVITEESTGSLVANGGFKGAGIGGNGGQAAGTITIQGGHIRAKGPDSTWDPAGIGGGGWGNAGTISITGGYVYAEGCKKGIGGGYVNTEGSITISGGVVVANGIGTHNGDSKIFTTITGGIVFSTGSINKDNENSWSGIIADDSNTATIYPKDGTGYTLAANDSIPEGYTLQIESGKTLAVGEGNTFTNKGTISIENGGTLQNNGTVINEGTLDIKGTVGGNKITPSLKLSASRGKTSYGVNHTFTYTYNGDGTVSAASSDGSTVSVSGNTVTVSPVCAGNATITVSAAEGYRYAATNQSYEVEVTKAMLTNGNFTFNAPEGLYYIGGPLTLGPTVTTQLSVGDITEKYYKEGGTESGLTQITDAGTYTVKIDVADSDNNNAVTNITNSLWKITVNKAPLTNANFTFTAPGNLVYTGEQLTVGTTVTTELTVGTITEEYYKDGELMNDITDAGTYTVKINVSGNDNYNPAKGITGDGGNAWTFTVAKKEIIITPKSGQVLFNGGIGSKIDYGQSVQNVTLSGVLSIEKNTEENTYKIVNPAPGGLTLNGADAGNYFLTFTENVPITVYDVSEAEVEATVTDGANGHGWANESLTLQAPTGFVFTDEGGKTSEGGEKVFEDEDDYYLKLATGGDPYRHLLPIDKTVPLVPTAPDEGSLTTTTATFTLSDTRSGIASYRVVENGREIATWPVTKATTVGEPSLVYTFTGTPGSTHTLNFEATDMAGNVAISLVKFTLKSNPYIPSYYDIFLESSDSVRLSSGSTSVLEGNSFTVTAEVAEGYDPATLVVEYKRGRSGVWRTLEADSNGMYRVRSVYDDIYVRASVRRDGDPTAVESVPGGASRIWAVGSRIRIGAARPVSVRVVSLGGHLVRSEQLPAGDSEIQGLPQGVYIVLLSDGSRGKVMIY
ncbi:hypothetical protein [uncultured Parabacteroides sp.]|uniref:hypothetical protein n=1 Tax=uncultured Parabacteroides sp. TaxID=512312 RepID=UPI0025D9CB6A|nr:hypothetical protein [uncultured Parabacteroides sp.]